MIPNLGYIKLHRKLLESQVFPNEGLLTVWIWCLLKANYKGAWAFITTGRGKSEVWVDKGQFVFGRHSAAKELKMNSNTIWKRMLKLKNIGNCNIESNRQYSLITIVNWDTYQGVDENDNIESNHQVTTECPPSNNQVTHLKKEKNIKKDKKDKKKSKDNKEFSLPLLPVKPELWEEFKQHRVRIKKPMTKYAEKLMVEKLNKFIIQGHDPEDLINKTIEKGWQDINPDWIYKNVKSNQFSEITRRNIESFNNWTPPKRR